MRPDYYPGGAEHEVSLPTGDLTYVFRTNSGQVACQVRGIDQDETLDCSNGKSTLHCEKGRCSVRPGPFRFPSRTFYPAGPGLLLRLNTGVSGWSFSCIVFERLIGCERPDGSRFSYSKFGLEEDPDPLREVSFAVRETRN